MNKDVKELLRLCRKQGAEVSFRRNGNIEVRGPNGMYLVHGGLSAGATIAMTRRKLREIGLVVLAASSSRRRPRTEVSAPGSSSPTTSSAPGRAPTPKSACGFTPPATPESSSRGVFSTAGLSRAPAPTGSRASGPARSAGQPWSFFSGESLSCAAGPRGCGSVSTASTKTAHKERRSRFDPSYPRGA